MSKLHFNPVGLFIQYNTPKIIEALTATFMHLKKLKVEIIVETQTAQYADLVGVKTVKLSDMGQHCQCVIVVGGDGSLLKCAKAIATQNLPILGINRGSLGFLADVPPEDLNQLTQVIGGHYVVEERNMLSVSCNATNNWQNALNEIVLARTQPGRLMCFDIYVDQHFVCQQRADGLIVATPTGSTAYSLSAGGPLMHPSLQAICLTALCPHKLNSRPMVIANDQTIDLHVHQPDTAQISTDGDVIDSQGPLNVVHIKKADISLKLIHPNTYNYFDNLKQKLHWERKIEVAQH